jgi:signal transduction histidine kinase
MLGLRELMQALRPIELDASEQLEDVLASVVERFRRDTGISARFSSTGGPFLMRTTAALEIVRIVQECLVNVRKHSRARNVLVRFTRADGHYTLVSSSRMMAAGSGSKDGAREMTWTASGSARRSSRSGHRCSAVTSPSSPRLESARESS